MVMADGIPSYDELKLRIARGAEGAYEVEAFGPDGSTASGSFSLPFDDTELENFVLRVGRPRRGVRAYRSSQMEDAKRFGSQLFDALLAGRVRDVYQGARRVAEQNERGLRVTLYLTRVPKLMEVPWEFLYDRPGFLSQSIYTPVVRSLDLKMMRPPRKLTLPLRILGMVSRPQGFETLEVGSEQNKLANALSALERDGMVELRWLERATLSALHDVVSAPDEVHVLHYIGHGAYDKRTEGGILALENADGGLHEVTGEELCSLLQDERSLRLVVLNSCEGARGSCVDPFSGVAASLVECGIPGVVGMQFEITDEAAITFAGRFYTALAQGFPIDAAIAQSRKAIFAAGNDIEFATPVLFLRSADARLFELEQGKQRELSVFDSIDEGFRFAFKPEQWDGAEGDVVLVGTQRPEDTLEVRRTNGHGTFVVWITKYSYRGQTEFIPADPRGARRNLRLQCKLRAVGAYCMVKVVLKEKDAPMGQYVDERKHQLAPDAWVDVDDQFRVDFGGKIRFRFLQQSVSVAPSSLQIRDVVITEYGGPVAL
jgi:hypothetical protein